MHTRFFCLSLVLAASATAQTKPAKPTAQQVVKPPVAQAWIDLATHQSDLPGMAGAMGQMMSGGGMPSLGSLFGKSDKRVATCLAKPRAWGLAAAANGWTPRFTPGPTRL